MKEPTKAHWHIHLLKTWPKYFDLVVTGKKTFEWRRDDKGFKENDVLLLEEWSPVTASFTGRQAAFRVIGILRGVFDIPPGYCIMSVKPYRYKLPATYREENNWGHVVLPAEARR